jgi:hypothetical protein
MEYYGLRKRSQEHHIGALIVAGFVGLVIATIVWPPLGDILNTIFLIVAITLGAGLARFVVWFLELHPPRWSRPNRQLDVMCVDHRAVPVLNGQPLTDDLPGFGRVPIYQGGAQR